METIKLLSPSQIKQIDKESIEKWNIPEILLMEDTAYGLFKLIEERFSGFKIVIACGPGNNGGDGMALARIMHAARWDVSIAFPVNKSYSGSSLTNFKLITHINSVHIKDIEIDKNTLVVDAIFGIGLNKVVSEEIALLFNKINNSDCSVLSVDIPSGINGLTGQIMGTDAIKADVTATICQPKIGMYMFPGFEYCGKIEIVDISIPKEVISNLEAPVLNQPIAITPRALNSHKTTFGTVLTIAGSPNYYGAPYFTSKTVLLAGCGYSTLISCDKINTNCAILAPEVIYRGYNELENAIKSSSSVVFGPGIGVSDFSKELLSNLVSLQPDVLIVDGDGLTIIAESPKLIEEYKGELILTPHPGEAGRLLNIDTAEVEKNRIESAKAVSAKYNAVCVLKGHHTLISSPDGSITLNTCSSQVLATAGSGDILCGVIAALVSRSTTLDAVKAGVYIHGLAGTILEKTRGLEGIIASDIMNTIPEALNYYINL